MLGLFHAKNVYIIFVITFFYLAKIISHFIVSW